MKSSVISYRVSVPKRTLQSSYHLRPHRRKSFDPTDSMGLSKVGYSWSQSSTGSQMRNSCIARSVLQPYSLIWLVEADATIRP